MFARSQVCLFISRVLQVFLDLLEELDPQDLQYVRHLIRYITVIILLKKTNIVKQYKHRKDQIIFKYHLCPILR